jgi:hypothetical protein
MERGYRMKPRTFRNGERARAANGRGSDSAFEEMCKRDRTKPRQSPQPAPAEAGRSGEGGSRHARDEKARPRAPTGGDRSAR